MSVVNIDKIINGTPQKRLLNGYKKMQENYTETSAREFYETYVNEPLSFLLENSRMIFSEPYFGCSYYKEAMMNNCSFNTIEREYEKVQDFLDENGSLMSESQRVIYEDLCSSLKTLLEHTKNTRIYSYYIKENIDDRFEEELANSLFAYEKMEEKNESDIMKLFETVTDSIVFFTYAPYVMEKTGSTSLYDMINTFCEKASIPEEYDEKQWKTFVESVICSNKLSLDKKYMEAVNSIQNRNMRFIFEYFMNTSLDKTLNDLVEEKVNESKVIYNSSVSAINNIFYDIEEAAVDADENNAFKKQIDVYKGIAYESSLDILVAEYQQSESTEDLAHGYSIIKESISLDNAFNKLNKLYSESVVYVTEADEEDVSDEDIDSLNDDQDDDREIGGQVPGKKPIAPEPKNKANKIQFNAMDKEAKHFQKNSIRKQKGQEIKNAAKAVTRVPMNVLNSIKGQIRNIDKADDDRRKNYMTEPGFRKKAFRNLKVAILYGTTANIKLALIPTVAICRHFSKKKDRRIRNELVRELQTEIRVCEEKISDANANGDQKEKYRLMRIKDQLDAEMVRVKTNSKYV